MSVKRAQPKDVTRLAPLCLEYVRYEHALNSQVSVPNKVAMARSLRKELAKRDVAYMLAEDAGALLGFVHVSVRQQDHIGHIDAIFVRKIARKRNVGKLLLSAALKFLKEHRVEIVKTFVPVANKQALSYWEHQFFKISGFELEKNIE